MDPEIKTNKLVAILATPPLTTSGRRTLGRLQLAAKIIGSDSVSVANLLEIATQDVLDIAHVGHEAEPWIKSREDLLVNLTEAESVLLAWGVTEPTGPARHHHRAQVAWLSKTSEVQTLPCWTVGGRTRHPSRWQRYTSKAFPGMPFDDALAKSLQVNRGYVPPVAHQGELGLAPHSKSVHALNRLNQ